MLFIHGYSEADLEGRKGSRVGQKVEGGLQSDSNLLGKKNLM